MDFFFHKGRKRKRSKTDFPVVFAFSLPLIFLVLKRMETHPFLEQELKNLNYFELFKRNNLSCWFLLQDARANNRKHTDSMKKWPFLLVPFLRFGGVSININIPMANIEKLNTVIVHYFCIFQCSVLNPFTPLWSTQFSQGFCIAEVNWSQ